MIHITKMIIYIYMDLNTNFSWTIELDSDGKLFDKQASRIVRIARGSGTTVHEVEELLTQYKRFAEMVKKMGGNKGLLKNMPSNPKNINPAQMAKMHGAMTKMLPPDMLKQMGGMSGIQNMMKQMGGLGGLGGAGRGGGMPDMAQMEKMMKNMFGGKPPGM